MPTLLEVEREDPCRSRAVAYLPCNVFGFWTLISGRPALDLCECGPSQALASESDLHLNAESTSRSLRQKL